MMTLAYHSSSYIIYAYKCPLSLHLERYFLKETKQELNYI
jgi:hypothetical protein